MTRISAEKAQTQLPELLSRAAEGKERIIVTRRGRKSAVVVPLDDLRLLEALEERVEKLEQKVEKLYRARD